MDIQKFNHEKFGETRVVDKNGDIWFIASDVASALGYAKPNNAINNHCRNINKINYPETGQPINIISESDVYRLVMRSKIPDAELFQDWVVEEVLPSIRKHGAYATDVTIDKILNDPDFGIQLLLQLKEERQKRKEAEHTNKILTHHNKVYVATEIAKELGFRSAIALNKKLSELGIQFKSNGTWVMYSKYANMGYVNIKQEVLDSGRVIYHRKWTQEGRKFLIELFDKKELACLS